MSVSDSTPILVGVGQSVSHWVGETATDAPNPISLARDATRAALKDSGAEEEVRSLIDTVVFVRLNNDSVEGTRPPFGRIENPPASLAEEACLEARQYVYSSVGGDQPQALVNEYAERLSAGSLQAVLIAGAEAIGAEKTARKKRLKLDWTMPCSAEMEDRGIGTILLTKEEIQNGLGFPVQTYPIFENALRGRLGLTREQYLTKISELFAPFSAVAAANPYAQYPVERTAEFLATESKENFRVSDTYLKWHVAQDAVNQGAAVIMTTVAAAKRANIPEEKWVYLHGYAQAKDVEVSQRPDLSKSKSIELTLKRALQSAKMSPEDLSILDIYSCFPCVVQIAAEELDLASSKIPLTVTGGLPFFGGAGNNYSMHAIATMVEKLREAPEQNGLVLANGGFMSKHAVGVYSARPKDNWQPVSSSDLQDEIAAQTCTLATDLPDSARVESYSVSYGRFAPDRGVVVAQSEHGRTFKRFHTRHRATIGAFLDRDEPLGSEVKFHSAGRHDYVSPAGSLSGEKDDREFRYVTIQRNGKILEVTLNRPDSYNALFGPAHFELAEIFDEFERDQDLWVAIISGAGDKAFCSGNDLKATAKGGDIGTPRSGFAGLCSRFNREKPIIAAVNGIAMGGGLEIVLACDLAIIDPGAKCALPEVKVGLFAAAGGVQRLTRQIGTKAAMELILIGRHFDAHEALELGVVNAISKPGKALEEARDLAEVVLTASPSAIQSSKRVLNEFEKLDYDLETSLKFGGQVFGKLMRTNDFKEGVTAFGEKRTPNWTNS